MFINSLAFGEQQMKTVSENEVLIACAKHLYTAHGVFPFMASVASGEGINSSKSQSDLKASFQAIGLPSNMLKFTQAGPDLVGITKEEWWEVECKGAGVGKSSTQNDSFDRALASIVAHFDTKNVDLSEVLGEDFSQLRRYLCLALPKTRDYTRLLKRKVRQPLRRVLNLWILIFDQETQSTIEISPEQDYSRV